MFKVPAFKEQYLARLHEFSDTIFSTDRLAAEVNAIATAIRPSVERESPQKLALFDDAVVDMPRPKGLRFVKPFSQFRTQSVRDQLAGNSEGVAAPPAFSFGAGRGAARRPGGGNGADAKPQGRTLAGNHLERLDTLWQGGI